MTAPADQPLGVEAEIETTIETEIDRVAIDAERLFELIERGVKALELIARELVTLRRHK